MLTVNSRGLDCTRRRLWGVPVALLGATVLGACSVETTNQDDEALGSAEQEMVYLDSPKSGKSTTGSIPALANATGRLAVAPTIFDQAGLVHEGYYSQASDLSAAPGSDRQAWIAGATSDEYAGSSTFSYHLGLAADHAQTRKSAFNEAVLGAAFQLFSTSLIVPPVAERYFTYPTERARWLEWQYGRFFFNQPESKYTYAPPTQLDDLRYQGARLYCAARKAQFVQNGQHKSMGELSPIKLKLLGNWEVDLLSIEPSVAIDGPERYTSSGINNGSQAFSVPLLLGTRIYPLKGLIPHGLGEIRYPTVLVSGDSEVYNRTNYRSIATSPPLVSYSKQYRSLSHADAIYSVYRPEVSAEKTLEIARLGPLAAELLLRLGVVVGDPHKEDGSAFNDRVMKASSDFPLAPAGVAAPPTRTGRMWGEFMGPRTYSDAPVLHNASSWPYGWYFPPSNAQDPSWWSWSHNSSDDQLRLRQNDDHHISPALRVSLTGGISGVFGGTVGSYGSGITVRLAATGSLTGSVSQEHDVRDGPVVEVATVPNISNDLDRMPFAATNVVVRPRTTADATVDFVVNLGIKARINLVFKTINITLVDEDLIHASKSIGEWNSDSSQTWDGDTHLRIGYHKPMDPAYPVVIPTKSYMPLATDGYNTFPGGPSDIQACLTDTTPLPPTPQVCGAESAPVQVPQAEVCFYTGGTNLENACMDPAAAALTWSHHWSTDAQRACYVEYIKYLCRPTTKQQWWNGERILAHRVPLSSSVPGADADADALNAVVAQCVQAFVGNDPTEAQADAWAKGFFQKGVCTSSAVMISNDDLLQLSDPNTTPPAVDKTPSGC